MKITMSDSAVPFVISFRKILRKPKMTRERKFVGAGRLIKNLLVKAIELIEEVAFETKINYVDPGESVVVHWAVTVPDAFDTSDGRERNLVAFRMLNDIPPNGAHFEIISPLREEKPPQSRHDPAVGCDDDEVELEEAPAMPSPRDRGPVELTPEHYNMLRRGQDPVCQSQDALLRETRGPNGTFRRPPDVAYAPRPIKTLEEEVAEGEAHDETAANMDRSGSEREDD